MKRNSSFIILIIIIIGIIVIPFSIISVLVNLNGTNSNPKWDYYIEPGIYTAQEEIHEGNITYSLETYMWRDFMPISPPDGKPLIVVIKIHASGVLEFPSTISLERLWLIYGTEIISALPTNEYKLYGSTYEMIFREGPKWGPGIFINVVVKLKGINFRIYYLKAIDQPIHRTD